MNTEAIHANRNKNRMILLIIGGVPIVVTAIATWLWFYVASGKLDLVSILGTRNNGVLIQPPRQIKEIPLLQADGQAFQYRKEGSDDPLLWTFLHLSTGHCDEACQQSLHDSRQIHIALGKEARRIRRVYVNSDVSTLNTQAEFLATEHRKLLGLSADRKDVEALLGLVSEEHRTASALRSPFFVVDPQGWVMMYYPGDQDGRDVIDDMKFLLKYSPEN